MVFALFSGAIASLLGTALGGALYGVHPALGILAMAAAPPLGAGYAYWVLRDREPEPVARIAALGAFAMATGMLLIGGLAVLQAARSAG